MQLMCIVVVKVLLGDSNVFSIIARVLLWTVMCSVWLLGCCYVTVIYTIVHCGF